MTITPHEPAQAWLNSYLEPSLVKSPPYMIDSTLVPIKLDQNESPYDWPLPLKQQITTALLATGWNRYPSSYNLDLEAMLAEHVGVTRTSILLSPGSNHLIGMLLSMLNQRRQGKLVVAQPSFALYEQWSQLTGQAYEPWCLDSNLQYDRQSLPAMPRGSILIFASPNNPVGNILAYNDLEQILLDNPESYIIADEAYCEFAAEPYTPLLAKYSNLILLRTFSKTMGAAGLRLGYCLASSSLIGHLRKLMLPYLLNHFTVLAATTVLQSPDTTTILATRIKAVIEERNKLFLELSTKARAFTVVPSAANFLLLRWPSQQQAAAAYEGLIAKGILLRNVSKGPGLSGCLRVTIGSPDDNTAVAAALIGL